MNDFFLNEKLKKIIIQLAFTLSFFSFLSLLIFEIPPRVSKRFSAFSSNRCDDLNLKGINFDYGSCPKQIYLNDPKNDYPEMKSIKSYTDEFGSRVSEKNFW